VVTFLLRFAAVLLVALALLPRGVVHNDRLLVVGLDGIRLDYVEQLTERGAMPTFSRLLADGTLVTLGGRGRVDRVAFWHEVLKGDDSGRGPWFWLSAERAGARVATIHLPLEQTRALADDMVALPGADPSNGFVGGSSGQLVRLDRIRSGEVGWPYDAASRSLAEWARMLKPGEASPWIDIVQPEPDARAAVTRLYVLDSTTAYLAPLYRRSSRLSILAPGSSGLYVADDPSWTNGAGRTRDYYYAHVRDLLRDRSAAAASLAREEWQVLVYVETAPLGLDRVYRDEADPGRSEDVVPGDFVAIYSELDARLGEIVDAAPPGTAIAIVGSSPPGKNAYSPPDESSVAGFLLVSGGDQGAVRTRADIGSVEPTLAMLAGVPLPARAGDPVSLVWKRFGRAPLRRAPAGDPVPPPREIEFSISELDHLGVFTASATASSSEDSTNSRDGSVESRR